MKRLRKIILYAFGLLLFTLLAISGLIYLNRGRIIEHVVTQANKQLNTPVRVDRIDVNWWSEFPYLRVVCTGVYVEDSHPETAALFVADKVSFAFNAWDMWKGRYVIQRVAVFQSQTFIKIDQTGVGNYNITRTSGDAAAVSFRLNRIVLQDAWLSFTDTRAQQEHRFSSDELTAALATQNSVYDIRASGQLRVEQIGVGNMQYLTDKDFGVEAHVLYDDQQREVRIDSSTLRQKNSLYRVAGTYQFSRVNHVDLTMRGQNADVQSLLAFLPAGTERALAKYQSDGKVYFSAHLKGDFSPTASPTLNVDFGWDRAALYHPEYHSRLEDAHLDGKLRLPAFDDLTRASLHLDNIRGKLNGQDLSARLHIENFRQALVTLDFSGTVDADFIQSVYRPESIATWRGSLAGDLHYEGPLGTWATPAPPPNVHGTVVLENVALTLRKPAIKLEEVNGEVAFNQVDVALSNVSGRLGKSDFQINGLFRNIVNHFVTESQPVRVEAELRSHHVDAAELLKYFSTPDEKSDPVAFGLSPAWALNFNCQIDHIRHQKFSARYLAGDLQIRNQLAVTRNVQMKTLGGELTFNAIVDAQKKSDVDVVGGFQLNKIYLDSIFYVLDDFGQDFIKASHLRGRIEADVALEMTLTNQLKLRPETLIADVTATLRGGELNNFEPFQKLNRFLDDEGLSKLRFADLRNEIHIENQTLYIPQMEIRSNVTTIQLSGTHTFGQQIDYRIVAPLRNRKKIDPDEAFGAIEESKGKSRIFLKLTGTTSNYEVSYDKSAVKQKIATDLKNEVKELKDAFRLKGKQKKKELELSEEEFDW